MIDLHMHTSYSDGADSLKEVLKKAEDLKLEYISITDHDNCKAYEEMKNINITDYYTGKIIPGIEIKCAFDNGKLIELLGYNIDTDKMQEWSNEYYKDKTKDKLQQKYFDILYNVCKKKYLRISPKDEIKFNPKTDWASVTIFRELQKHKENYKKLPDDFLSEFDVFSKKYCADEKSEFYIDKSKDYPSTTETVEIIRKCGGLVFMPHVYIYRWIEDKDEHIKYCMEKYNVDGIECYHSSFDEEKINHLLRFCKENNLLISGGSDYHGENKPNIEMAIGKGNLNIDKKYVENWVKPLKGTE